MQNGQAYYATREVITANLFIECARVVLLAMFSINLFLLLKKKNTKNISLKCCHSRYASANAKRYFFVFLGLIFVGTART
jgi:hypothetical protein